MTRQAGWEDRLIAVFDDWRGRPFAWGQSDCAAFAVACVQASLPDFDPGLSVYDDPFTAEMELARLGGMDVGAVMARSFRQIPTVLAGRGDIGTVEWEGRVIAAVCFGPMWWAKSESGLLQLRRHHVARAFRVG